MKSSYIGKILILLILLTFSYTTNVYAFPVTGKVVEISPNEIAITETNTTSSSGGGGGGGGGSAAKSSANSPPKITRYPTISEKIRTGESGSFTWAAEDPDGDSLSWSVSWGDGAGMAQTCPAVWVTTIPTVPSPLPMATSNTATAESGTATRTTSVAKLPDTKPLPPPSSSGRTFTSSHAWKNPGTYVVEATVSDCKGGSDSYSIKVFVSGEGKCNIEKCRSYICCEPKKGEACPLGLPIECSECTKDICGPVCGNNICEAGEADDCPVIVCVKEPCPQKPCYKGTCPQDCARSKIKLEITRPKSGERVSGTVNVEATAKGEGGLGDMYLEITPSTIVYQTPPCENPPCPAAAEKVKQYPDMPQQDDIPTQIIPPKPKDLPQAEKAEQYPMKPPTEIGTRPITRIKFTDCVTAVSETQCEAGKECRSLEIQQCKYKWDTSRYKGWTSLRTSISDSAKNWAEDIAKVYVYSRRQPQPVCDKIGTEEEGWYTDGQLLRYEKCSCRAVCSRIGSGEEGWYSSCTNDVIKYEKCSIEEPIEVTIKNKPVKIEQRPYEGIVQIVSEDKAMTKEKIIIKEDRLEMPTIAGASEIKYLPEEARDKAIEQAQLYKITAIEIKKENEKPVYEVTGKKKEYFLWIIPYDADKTVKVDAETNEVVG
ncbi:MAG: hypothetical protein HYX24_06860 [Candidatus Aenigmarchaeota archaeon]|nr:hypothetical protein [Candidatus Aenigmarchaeota archaeon]